MVGARAGRRTRGGLVVALAAVLLGLLVPVASAAGTSPSDLAGPYTGITILQTGADIWARPQTRALDARTSTVAVTGSRGATSETWRVTFTPRVGDPVAVRLSTRTGLMSVGALVDVSVVVGTLDCDSMTRTPLTEYHADATGRPDVLAVDISGGCYPVGASHLATTTGQLRLAASAPYGGLDIPLPSAAVGPLLLGEASKPVTVPVGYVGAGSVTPVGTTVVPTSAETPNSQARFTEDTCSGATLVDGSTCRLAVSARRTSTYGTQGIQVGLRGADGGPLSLLMVDTFQVTPDARGAVSAFVNRAWDTRVSYGNQAPHAVVAGGVLAVPVGRYGSQPDPSLAGGLALVNLTAVTPASPGYLSVLTSATATTTTSALNFSAGRTTTNLVVAPVDAGGFVHVRNVSARPLDVVADLEGVTETGVAQSGATVVPTGRLHPVVPSRVLDTRTASGGARPLPTGDTTLGLHLPASTCGCTAVMATVTVVSPGLPGWIRLGSSRDTSSLTFARGETTSNTVLAWLGGTQTNDGLTVTVSGGPVHVVVDVVAVVDGGSSPTGLTLAPVPGGQVRIADSRRGVGLHTLVAGRAQPLVVPSSLRDQDTWGIVQNLTAIPANPTWLVAYPSGTPRPATSSLLATRPGPRAGGVLTQLAATGSQDVYSNGGPTDLVSDVSARVQLFPSTAQLGGFARIPETLAAIPPATRSR